MIFIFLLSLVSCNGKNVLIVTTDFWWEINNENNSIIEGLKTKLKGNDSLSINVNRFEVREIKNWATLETLLRDTTKEYGYYVFDPVVSKWIILYETDRNWQESGFSSFVRRNNESKFIFLVGKTSEKLCDFNDVIQVLMEEKSVFSYGAKVVKELLKSNDVIKKLYADKDIPSIGVIYYTPDYAQREEKNPRITAFESVFTDGSVSCLEKRLRNTENKIKAKLALEELRDKGVKIFLFDAYSLNPYLISLAEKNNLVYIVNYMRVNSKTTTFHNLLFSFDYDYARLIADSLSQVNKVGWNEKVKVDEDIRAGNIVTGRGFIWWGNYIKMPKRYKNNGIIRN